jgi:hypothetical protein
MIQIQSHGVDMLAGLIAGTTELFSELIAIILQSELL